MPRETRRKLVERRYIYMKKFFQLTRVGSQVKGIYIDKTNGRKHFIL